MSLINKPLVVEKFKSFHNYVKNNDGKIGTKQRGIDLNLNNACNLRCEHCFTNSSKGENVKETLPLEVVERVANEAHELCIFEWDLQGGELLSRPQLLFDTLKAMKTERFYVYLTTNGWYMTKEIAQTLADLGVNRVSVSIDSMDSETHDRFRGRKGSWERAIKALEMVQEVGISPYLNITVGRYNAQSEDVKLLLDFSKQKKYTTLLNVATPGGMWAKMTDIMVNEEDKAYLINMRKKYKNILRNLWNPFDREREGVIGCNTVNRLYITPAGDVLVCPYVHIKIGNVKEQSLAEISKKGFSVKHFRNYSSKCLAGEDKDFVKKFMSKEGTTIFNPALADDIFGPEDFVKS